MFNSSIHLDSKGFVIAKTEYSGLVAFYLVSNDKPIEKEFYKKRNNYKFKTKPNYGVLSVVFFFKDSDGVISKYQTERVIYDGKYNILLNIDKSLVFDSLNNKIEFFNQGSDITFITFNGAGTTKNTIPFGQSYILKNRWNLIAVYQDNNSQYQSLDIDTFYSCVNPLITNSKVFVYGSSLGGYCALYFGGCINATIIAASPKNSAHPSIRKSVFSELNFEHKDFSEIPTSNRSVYIVYDSKISVDKKFIYNQVVKAYPKSEILALPKSTHAVLKTMLSNKVLQLYISSIICNSYNKEIAEYIKNKCNKY